MNSGSMGICDIVLENRSCSPCDGLTTQFLTNREAKMIVVSASLKKSGSGWFFNMTNDLLVQAGHQDVRALRAAYGLESVLREQNCRINPRLISLARLLPLHARGNTFVLKTHAGPTPSLRLLMAMGIAKATYIYRDPRDVVLSALDHGERVRQAGKPNVMAQLHSVEDAVRFVEPLLGDWEAWTKTNHTLLVRYEDLLHDTLGQLHRLAAFLRLDVSQEDLHRVMARYAQANQDAVMRENLHFNTGIAGRFRSKMTPEELDLCTKQFDPYLKRMGYAA